MDPAKPLAPQVALVTGANTGIGLVTARQLAAQGAHVFIACRSQARAADAIAHIERQHPGARVEALVLDLGDFGSVRSCAQAFLARDLPLHLLINNAGLAGARGMTASGFEIAFGVNHMGHFLLTQLLLPRLRQSAPARIVTVASRAHERVPGIDWDAVQKPTKTRVALHEYGVSKLANVLFSAELAKQLAGSGVTTYALHPGVVASEVWREVPWPIEPLMKWFMLTPEEGARTTLYCATSAAAGGETGLYYDKSRAVTPGGAGRDPELAAELWRRSQAFVAAAAGSSAVSGPAASALEAAPR